MASETELEYLPEGRDWFVCIEEGVLGTREALDSELICISGANGYAPGTFTPHCAQVNLKESKQVVLRDAGLPGQKNYAMNVAGVKEQKVIYTPTKDPRFEGEEREEEFPWSFAGDDVKMWPTKQTYLDPRVVGFLFGDNPYRCFKDEPTYTRAGLFREKKKSTTKAVSVSEFNRWKCDASELINDPSKKSAARGNIFAALANSVNEDDRLSLTDEMLRMVEDIYVTARFDKANSRERFLLHKMMLLCHVKGHKWL